MSGGSYNYLCFKEAGELLSGNCASDLRQMIERLSPICPEAANEAAKLETEISIAISIIGARLEILKPLFKAVEWRDSGDWGDDILSQAIDKWRNEHP